MFFSAVTSGLQWTSPSSVRDNVTIPACVDQDVSIPWNYTLDAAEHEVDVEWYFTPDHETREVFLGTFVRGHFLPEPSVSQQLELIPSVGLRLVTVRHEHSGVYSVHINVNLHGSIQEHVQRVHVVVTDELIAQDGRLQAHFQGARFMNTTQDHQLILVCGVVNPLWVSNVDIEWTTPLNQTLASTFQENGQFALAVPNPFLTGTYSCHITDLSPATVCIPSDSPLTSGATVTVDGVESRIALMDSRERQMAEQIHTLQGEKAQMATEIQTLQHNLTTMEAVMKRMYQVRLAGGDSTSGRVEVLFGETWGTVCDDVWTTNHAKVVCRQLGLPTANAVAYNEAHFGPGTGPIFMDSVHCAGTEDLLVQCAFPGLSIHDCSHSEDAGVSCA